MVHGVDTEGDSNLVVVVGGSEVAKEGVAKDDGGTRGIIRVLVLVNSDHALNSFSGISHRVTLSGNNERLFTEFEGDRQEEIFEFATLVGSRKASDAHARDSGVAGNTRDLAYIKGEG